MQEDPTNNGVEEIQEQPEAQSQIEAQAPVQSEADRNWAEARRKISELERDRILMAQELEKLKKPATAEEDDLATLSEEEIITVKQAKKLAEMTAKQVSRQVLKEREAATAEERILAKYQDFRDVVTDDKIQQLNQQEPGLARYLSTLKDDPFLQAEEAYKYIKRLLPTESPQVAADKKRALDNAAKPVSVQAIAKASSPIGQAHQFENGLTKELKTQLWNEMRQAIKSA